MTATAATATVLTAIAAQIKKLANDIGLTRLWLVGNKVRNGDEAKFLEAE